MLGWLLCVRIEPKSDCKQATNLNFKLHKAFSFRFVALFFMIVFPFISLFGVASSLRSCSSPLRLIACREDVQTAVSTLCSPVGVRRGRNGRESGAIPPDPAVLRAGAPTDQQETLVSTSHPQTRGGQLCLTHRREANPDRHSGVVQNQILLVGLFKR